MPQIGFNYFYLNREDRKAQIHLCVIMTDSKHEAVCTLPAGRKGVDGCDWLAKFLVMELGHWGHARDEAIFKCDGEHSIEVLVTVVDKLRGVVFVPERSPPGQSQSNGQVEICVLIAKNSMRTMKAQLEHDLQGNLKEYTVILQWFVRWAGVCHNRYVVGRDGRTPYKIIRTRPCTTPIARIGENILYKETRTKNISASIDSDWQTGVWAGLAVRTGETIVLTPGEQ